ncbi:MAG TPA: hypothetical protein VND94_18805 [Terriglobia bacterium]|nr:hypothetical protein [Terriglobia bacterium]
MSVLNTPSLNDGYIAEIADILTGCGVPNARAEAFRFVSDNPGMDAEMSAQLAADKWLAAGSDVIPDNHLSKGWGRR